MYYYSLINSLVLTSEYLSILQQTLYLQNSTCVIHVQPMSSPSAYHWSQSSNRVLFGTIGFLLKLYEWTSAHKLTGQVSHSERDVERQSTWDQMFFVKQHSSIDAVWSALSNGNEAIHIVVGIHSFIPCWGPVVWLVLEEVRKKMTKQRFTMSAMKLLEGFIRITWDRGKPVWIMRLFHINLCKFSSAGIVIYIESRGISTTWFSHKSWKLSCELQYVTRFLSMKKSIDSPWLRDSTSILWMAQLLSQRSQQVCAAWVLSGPLDAFQENHFVCSPTPKVRGSLRELWARALKQEKNVYIGKVPLRKKYSNLPGLFCSDSQFRSHLHSLKLT